MNETTYNFAMLTKDYLDQAIKGVETAAPKVWWYLQYKCWIDGLEYILWMIITIIAILYYKKYIRRLVINFNDDKYNLEIVWIFLIVISTCVLIILIVHSLTSIISLITAFSPICPIDKAIELGTNIIK